MRRLLFCLTLVGMTTHMTLPSQAQQKIPSSHAKTTPLAAPPAVPHAWLFGSWSGGLFPVPKDISAAACQAQPTVIFTRDAVQRATLIEPVYHQRSIETVRSNSHVTDFRFIPGSDTTPTPFSNLAGNTPPPAELGFGCADANSLHVVRHSQNEIVFEGCADFPEPLIRCTQH